MESTFQRIQTEISASERDFDKCISILKDFTSKWSAIQKSFTEFHSEMDYFQDFPDLQSRLELAQLSACDSIISEMSRQIVLLEHNLTNNRATYNKATKTFESKSIGEAWSFPPSIQFLPDIITQTGQLIDDISAKLEKRKLAIYKIANEEESINPESLERLITSIQ